MADPTALLQQLVMAVEPFTQQQTYLQAQFETLQVSVAPPAPLVPLPVISPVALEAPQTHPFLADAYRT